MVHQWSSKSVILLAVSEHTEVSPLMLAAMRVSITGTTMGQDSGKQQPTAQEHAKALARIMILDSRYFPAELYSDKERK